MDIKTFSPAILLLIVVNIDCSAFDIENGPYQVSFNSYKVYDHSRTYFLGKDSISRPLLIHFWYPTNEKGQSHVLDFKHYIDLIAQREDFGKSMSEIDDNSFYYVKGYADYAKSNFCLDTGIAARQILDAPVSAKGKLPIHLNDPAFPLIIYAPSNGKVSVQNHLICEYLASHGFMILSVASAGPVSINREDIEESTLAQVKDMEYILDYLVDSLHIQYSNLGLFGFSTGGNAITLFQMRNKHVKALLSLDGSHEYSYYMKLYKMEDFDLGKMDVPYLSIVNKYEDYSIYPYYNSITSSEKYIFRMPYLDHFGFISYWRFFESVSSDSNLSNLSLSYDYMCECTMGFFTKYLKSEPSLFETKLLRGPDNEYIQPISPDLTSINTLCTALLDNNLDSASRVVELHKSILFEGENQLNLLARMFMDKEAAIWLYQKSITYQPDSWEAHYGLGNIYKEKGETILAKNSLRKAKELNPENSKINDLLIELEKME